MSWPRRTRICLECRAALSDGEPCTWVRHTPISPSEPEQHSRLMEAVWPAGPPPLPFPWSIGVWIREMVEKYGHAPPPPGGMVLSPTAPVPPPRDLRAGPRAARGAEEEPLWTARSRYAGRVVEDAPTEPSPIAGTACVAYGLWLLCPDADRSAVLLRDGATIGFDVDLDDGRLARVPPGSADVVADGVRLRRGRHHERLCEYLVHLGLPERDDKRRTRGTPSGTRRRPKGTPSGTRRWTKGTPSGTKRSHLPFTEVREAVVRPGDHVRLLADLEVVPDRRSVTGSAYREAAGAVLSPVGRVVIELGNS